MAHLATRRRWSGAVSDQLEHEAAEGLAASLEVLELVEAGAGG